MAKKTDVAARRKLRQMEAKRDNLMEGSAKMKVQLAEVRAAIRAMRRR